MSNTSTATPYDAVGTLAGACIVGAIAVTRWLMEETPEDRAAVEALRAQRRQELLGRDRRESSESLQVSTVHLHLREPEPLLQAAEKLGYRMEPLTELGHHTAEQPLLLRGTHGERLAITRNDKGALAVSTVGDRHRIQALVRQQVIDRAVEHLRSTGQVQSYVLPNGEVQLQAREQHTGQPGGQAVISVQIRQDGTLWADVDKVRGPRCRDLVEGLAQAVGGQVVESEYKEAFYQLPGEPTKTRLQL